MSAAQLDMPDVLPFQEVSTGYTEAPMTDLKQQVTERLAAHRQRRSQAALQAVTTTVRVKERPANQIAATVAARYAQSPSYRAFLAEEAKRAFEQAAAIAEVARRNAEAVAQAQQKLLDELELWTAPQEFTPQTASVIQPGPVPPASGPVLSASSPVPAAASALHPAPLSEPGTLAMPSAFSAMGESAETGNPAAALQPVAAMKMEAPTPIQNAEPQAPVRQVSTAGFTVRLYEDVGRMPVTQTDNGLQPSTTHPFDIEEGLALDEEIAFRQSPVFEEPAGPPVTIPANLLEFPRHLVATRKVRPRLAEGPLRDDLAAAEAADDGQLRIFEVVAVQPAPEPQLPPLVPEWSSIWLDPPSVSANFDLPAEPEYELSPAAQHENLSPVLLPPQTASFALRVMAAVVDGAIVFAGFLGFVSAFAAMLPPAEGLPKGVPALLAAVASFAVLYFTYQVMFFTFSDDTPGMRYARIGLCTFTDENPTRAAMRRRILATVIAACPLGLGILWAWMDDDRLGWHDRISRMYQRSY